MGYPPLSVIIPVHDRVDCLERTLAAIRDCQDGPDEIIVHLDAVDSDFRKQVELAHPKLKIITSEERLGPGGSRNRLIRHASHEWVVSFDDDSFPAHQDFFKRVRVLIQRFPNAAVISSASHEIEWQSLDLMEIGIYSGCGCVFRKSAYLATQGFVPLPIAYGMEEVDLSAQLFAQKLPIIHDPLLRVCHIPAPDRVRDMNKLKCFALCNIALFAYLRYPMWLFSFGILQFLKAVTSTIVSGHFNAAIRALVACLPYVIKYRQFRCPISSGALIAWHRRCRVPFPLAQATDMPWGWDTK